MIDLRSDTVTRPTMAMREAMASAEVGDDVFGEDPTVNRLQETVAVMLGKEAGLFVPSGVMGNQLALKLHTQPGDEVIVERQCHIFNYESGAPGLLSGVQLAVLDGNNGILEPEQISRAVRPGYYWEAPSRLVCLENTINKAGGVIYPLVQQRAIADVAREAGLALHLDGARLWNAAIGSGHSEKELAAPFDTVNVCLSKGLGAPVGSVLVGSREHIKKAHRYRKLFGGGMRQVGILAAAGLYALAHHHDRLADDHTNAYFLAEGIASIPSFSVDLATVQSNIVMFDVHEQPVTTVLERLQGEGILMVPFGPTTIRATTHLDVSTEDIEHVLSVMNKHWG